ncbi:hypothetical protein [Yoonia sp. 208BN28-4]|uniref:hypothetical protein n=1 Tax=Yoonia sp. 208BN28-4 TaxID=3126505 RepID=UPI0030A9F7B8
MSFLAGIWAWLAAIDPRIWQAVLAGFFVATGWVYNGRRNRREAAALRAERLRDVHRALFAEIGANLSNMESREAIFAGRDRILQRMQEDRTYHPFIVQEHKSNVFDAIVGDIHVLPRSSIDAVVAYYAQLSTIRSMVTDLRSKDVRDLSLDRREALYRDYIELRAQTFEYGNFALAMIDAYSQGGAEAAKAAAQRLSSLPSAPPSDP